MSKTTHYELNTPIGSEVLSVMTGLNPNFTAIDRVMYDNETRSTQALNKANVNEQNIATALGRITTAEGDIDTLESGLQTANTNISGLTSRMSTAETNITSANNRIQENTGSITNLNAEITEMKKTTFGTEVTLTKDVDYITPKDGYFVIKFSEGSVTGKEYVYGKLNNHGIISLNAGETHHLYGYQFNSVFVRKGTTINFDGTSKARGSFFPIE